MGETEKCTAADVLGALERRMNQPGKPASFATFRELSDGAQRRRIDFLAVNMWQSRGRIVHGFEVKVERRDWLKEIEHPKADSWFSVCDHWWVAAPQGIVKVEELPAPWGLLECAKRGGVWRVKAVVEAPTLKPAFEWPSWLVMRLLTRGAEARMAEPSEITAARQKGRDDAQAIYESTEVFRQRSDESLRRSASELQALLQAIGGSAEFKWRDNTERIRQIRRAVALLDTGRIETIARRAAQMFREAADSIEASLPTEGEFDG